MNKRIISLAAAGSLLFTASLPLQGCYGGFNLTHKLYKWNGTAGDKWINSLVFVGLSVVGIYGITLLADGVVFNTVEFWTGSNPVTMAAGQKETKIVSIGGKDFMVLATQNQLELAPVDQSSKPMTMVFDPAEKSWFVMNNGQKVKIGEQDNQTLTLMYPDGRQETLTR